MTLVADLSERGAHDASQRTSDGGAPVAVVIGHGETTLWGMDSAERLRRSFARAGIAKVVTSEGRDPVWSPGGYVMARADWVYDEALIAALVKAGDTRLVADDGQTVALHVAEGGLCGADLVRYAAWLASGGGESADVAQTLPAVTAAGLAGSYDSRLRKRAAPLLMALTAASQDAVEKRIFAGSYKGVTDAITKYLWPAPARRVTKWCARLGVTPNQVTFASLFFVLLAFGLFWQGAFALGLLAAWLMTFLDTVDGKLARVTLTATRIGNVFDHGIDLVHPPFWWWAWFVGVGQAGFTIPNQPLLLALVISGYVLQRIEEGIFIAWFGIEMHIWRRFDSWFRLITARRNPNLVLLTAGVLIGRPDLGIVAVAYWTAVSLIVHTVQILQALAARRKGPLVSWLAR